MITCRGRSTVTAGHLDIPGESALKRACECNINNYAVRQITLLFAFSDSDLERKVVE